MAASKENIVIAFDLYGTILSTESIAKALAEHFGQEKAATLAATWRKYQLEYTWRSNSMKRYIPFSEITQQSLVHTLAESSLSLSNSQISDVISAYDSLGLFPDVGPALSSLSAKSTLTAVIFSNGTQSMVSNSVYHSPELSEYASVFKDIITVEEVKCFKPAPEVYEHLAKKVGKEEGNMGEIVLVSGNPFDIVGGNAAGLKTIWVDRQGNGWQDELVHGEGGRPDVIVKELGEVVGTVQGWV